jgi:hypothetical protein
MVLLTDRPGLTPQQLQILDIQGLDLLAQAEAMLRSIRSYQTAVQRLRLDPARAHDPGPSIASLYASVSAMRASCSQLSAALDEIKELVESTSGADTSGGG